MMSQLLPVFAVLHWILGDGAPPNLQQFENIPFLFISLFLMFWPLLLILVFAGLIFALLEVAAPGSTAKIRSIFKL